MRLEGLTIPRDEVAQVTSTEACQWPQVSVTSCNRGMPGATAGLEDLSQT